MLGLTEGSSNQASVLGSIHSPEKSRHPLFKRLQTLLEIVCIPRSRLGLHAISLFPLAAEWAVKEAEQQDGF